MFKTHFERGLTQKLVVFSITNDRFCPYLCPKKHNGKGDR